MKKPKVSFNKQSLTSFVLGHGEKVLASIIALAACGLAWGGVTALRTMRPSPDQEPESIIKDATDTAAHIEAVKIAPDDELTSEKGLAANVAKWLSQKVEPLSSQTVFDRPLFSELARRTGPDILPVEDLRAVAGVAVLALKPKAVADRGVPDRPPTLEPPAPVKPNKPQRGGRGAPPPTPPMPPEMAMMQPRPDLMQTQGKIVPYVVVTGLIPVKKQWQEYDRRFANASFRDPALDMPSWNSVRIEKTEVLPGVAEKWTPIDMKAVARRYATDWMWNPAEPFLATVVLPAQQERRDPTASPIPFCSPLPQLADGGWGFNGLHPWFADYLRRDAAERKEADAKRMREAEASGNVFGNPAAGGFEGALPPAAGFNPEMSGSFPGSTPGSMPGSVPGSMPGMGSGSDAMHGMPGMSGMATMLALGPEYRLFRFIDLAVIPGHTYRYRVKVVCWNPNFNVNSRHLAEPSLAKATTIESAPSGSSSPVSVPDSNKMLAQPMKRDQIKKLKAGTVGVTILGEKAAGGGFSLRQLLMEVGGLANVDPEVNKRGDPRSIGDAILTERVLLDFRGKLEDRSETRTGKPTPPPEPLEMLFLRPDGTFEVASSAESQPEIERYRFTLPMEGQDPAARGATPPVPGSESPFGNPFAPSRK